MEFAAGILKKETLELPQILEVKESDREILVEGTVHSIRNRLCDPEKKRRSAAGGMGGGKDRYSHLPFEGR